MPSGALEKLYKFWSKKSSENIEWDIYVSNEKSKAALSLLPNAGIREIGTILEIGCGFGRNLLEAMSYTNASFGLGLDVSKDAVSFAQKHHGNDKIKFISSDSMDIKGNIALIQGGQKEPFDLVILFDILEHIPKTKEFIRALAPISKHFLIKLPLENGKMSVFRMVERLFGLKLRGRVRRASMSGIDCTFFAKLGRITPMGSTCEFS